MTIVPGYLQDGSEHTPTGTSVNEGTSDQYHTVDSELSMARSICVGQHSPHIITSI